MPSNSQLEHIKTDVIEQLVPDLEAKTYASGKEGFFVQGKLSVAGKRYQAQIMLVEIQPK